jgi:carboxymethylenebutenolidase
MTKDIQFYFACISPWSYLATERLQDIAGKHDRTIAFKPIDVGRAWSTTGGGRPMGERPQVALDYRLVELPRWRAYRNVPLNVNPKYFPVAHQLSSHVIIAANQAGNDVYPLTLGLMRGCWADERDISDPDTVAAIADEAGLDGGALVAAAQGQAVADEMAANTYEALAAGAWSVPSIVVDGELFFGQDRLELIEWRFEGGGPAY